MKSGLFARALAASTAYLDTSPQQRDKDRAIQIARNLVNGVVSGIEPRDQKLLAQQLLRALALPV